jgi:hypothetical protein
MLAAFDGTPGVYPAAQYLGDGMDYNVGGVTPVRLYADTIAVI